MALYCGGSALFFWQLRHPFIRLASPVANDLAGFAWGLGLPWLAVIALFNVRRSWSKAVAIAAVLPLLLYSVVFFLISVLTGFSYSDGHDLSFDRFAETHWNGAVIRLYRTNGGATTDYGVVIRLERALLPGVLLVRRVDDFYPCYSLNATPTDNGISVTAERSECTALREHRREYQLKPFVYF